VSDESDLREDAPLEGPDGRAISPELLRLIQRVAHREYLLDGTPAPRPRTTAPRSPARRRPAIGVARSSAARAARGTTARKVTWS